MKNHVKVGSVVSEGGNPVVERPKLNLKPRKDPILQTEGDVESKRLFVDSFYLALYFLFCFHFIFAYYLPLSGCFFCYFLVDTICSSYI